MIDKDVVQDVLPGYYKDEDSVYNIYHERCKSLKWFHLLMKIVLDHAIMPSNYPILILQPASAYEYAVWTKQKRLMIFDYTDNVLYDVLIYFIIRTSLALTPLMIRVPN